MTHCYLGINVGHDASVALVSHSNILYAAAEERFSRIKNHRGFPFRALADVCDRYPNEVRSSDAIGLATLEGPAMLSRPEIGARFSIGGGGPIIRIFLGLEKKLRTTLRSPACVQQANHSSEFLKATRRALGRVGLQSKTLTFYDHHLCHATAAYLSSPFRDCVIVTSDGRGDGISATVSTCLDGILLRQHAIGDCDSIGQFYGAVTAHLGLKPNRHEGKVLGLAAMGNRNVVGPRFLGHLRWLEDGTYGFRLPPRYHLRDASELEQFIARLRLDPAAREILYTCRTAGLLTYKAAWFGSLTYLREVVSSESVYDVAAGAQELAEAATLGLVKNALSRNREGIPIALAGGVFANVRLNGLIAESSPSKVFVLPAMGDDGLAIGAASLAGTSDPSTKRTVFSSRKYANRDVYLGPQFTPGQVLAVCASEGLQGISVPDLHKSIAADLMAGLVVGVFRGRMEFGPRALGHRSILASAVKPGMQGSLNQRLNRSDFMPFAPSILAEMAQEYLEEYDVSQTCSEFMTRTYRMTRLGLGRIPAAAHVDGTVRPHVVHHEREPFLHEVLLRYRELSGIGAVLNTSFNAHESPIVGTPRDAIRSLKQGCVDRLVLESFVVGAATLPQESTDKSAARRDRLNNSDSSTVRPPLMVR